MSTTEFAKVFDVNGKQILMEALPSKNPEKLAQGLPDVVVTTDMGWMIFQSRIELSLTADGKSKINDAHDFVLSTFTQEKANSLMEQIQEEYSGEALVKRMLESGQFDPQDPEDAGAMEHLNTTSGSNIAKIIEVNGRQVVAVVSGDLGQDEEQDGLIIKAQGENGKIFTSQFEGMTLDDFTQEFAEQRASEADKIQTRKPKP